MERKNKPKYLKYFFVFIFVLTCVFSVSLFVNNGSVNALEPTEPEDAYTVELKDLSPEEQAKVVADAKIKMQKTIDDSSTRGYELAKKDAAYWALGGCIQNFGFNTIGTKIVVVYNRMTAENAKSGGWMNPGISMLTAKAQIGIPDIAINNLTPNVSLCNTIIPTALPILGLDTFEERIDLLCDMGFNSLRVDFWGEGKEPCKSDSVLSLSFSKPDTNWFTPSVFKSKIIEVVPDLVWPSSGTDRKVNMEIRMRQLSFWKVLFMNGCVQGGSIQNGALLRIPKLNVDGLTEYEEYLSGQGFGLDHLVKYVTDDFQNDVYSKTCGELMTEVFNSSLDYMALVNEELEELTKDMTEEQKQAVRQETQDALDAAKEAEAAAAAAAAQDPISTCAVDTIGWIVCPAVKFLTKIADGAYLFLEKNFLSVEDELFGNQTQSVWKAVVNIANIAFIFAFLIIIFSQITSIGISNYGIKKMLPKLIIAIILVNLSFIICQLLVDVSNVVGHSLSEFFSSGLLGDDWAANVAANDIVLQNSSTGEGAWGAIGGVVLVAGGAIALWASLATLIPIVIGAIIAAVTMLFILAARKAIIVMLVVLSPLAFVAYLLPNTEGLYKKWQKTFMAMLMIYPIVAFVFAASKLASTILGNVYSGTYGTNPDAGQNIGNIIAAGIGVIPLFIVPGLIKKSLDAVGSIGAKISGIGDKLGKGASSKYSDSKFQKNWVQQRATKKSLIEGGQYQGKNPFNKARAGLHKKFNNGKISGRYGNVVAATGVATAVKQNKEDVEMAGTQLDRMDLSENDLRKVARGEAVKGVDKNDIAMRQAAIKQMVGNNDVDGIDSLWNDTIDMDDSENSKLIRSTFAESLMASSGRPAHLGAGAIAGMKTHSRQRWEEGEKDGKGVVHHGEYKTDPSGKFIYDQMNTDDTIVDAMNRGVYSAEKLSKADQKELIKLNEVKNGRGRDKDGKPVPLVTKKPIEADAAKKLEANAYKAVHDDALGATVGKTQKNLEDIAGTYTPPAKPPVADTDTSDGGGI